MDSKAAYDWLHAFFAAMKMHHGYFDWDTAFECLGVLKQAIDGKPFCPPPCAATHKCIPSPMSCTYCKDIETHG